MTLHTRRTLSAPTHALRQLFTLLGAVAILTGTVSAATANDSSAMAALLAAEDALFAADVHRDVAAIERGFATEAVFVHANGQVQTKSDYLQSAAKGNFASIAGENRVVRIFGNVGVVRGTKNLVLANGMHLSGSYLTVYIRRDARWQMLDEQSAPAPKPPEGP